MLKTIGCTEVVITSDVNLIRNSSHLIIPGVGHFDNAMQRLFSSGLDLVIIEFASSNKPILGICLGMQILGLSSEEGIEKGLGLIPFINRKINGEKIKVPHMGWNNITTKQITDLSGGLSNKDRFYFVHSYFSSNVMDENILFTTVYGEEFVSGVVSKNIYGVQFHPEKSHFFGMKLLKNFIGTSSL